MSSKTTPYSWTLCNIKIKKLPPEEIRKEFAEFVGIEKYTEFVLTLYEAFPLRERLFFWQEQLLHDFSREMEMESIAFESVHAIFNQCPIHNYVLKNENVPIVDGNQIRSSVSYEESQKTFPMANVNAPRDLERFDYPKEVNVMYCEKCRE